MTPDQLDQQLSLLSLEPDQAATPAEMLAALEDRIEREPTNPVLHQLLLHTHARATAKDGLPRELAGVRLEVLVRWDAWTTTWEGTLLASGRLAQVRALRPHLVRDPLLRRMLGRQARLFESVAPGPLQYRDEPWPTVCLELPGPTAWSQARENLEEGALARDLTRALTHLARYETLELALPRLDSREWTHGPHGLQVACLTLPSDPGPDPVEQLVQLLRRRPLHPDDPVGSLLLAMEAHPPRTTEEAAELLVRRMAEVLAGSRHALRRQASTRLRVQARDRLLASVRRLSEALPPPRGRGAIGVDLEGRVLVLEGHDGALAWGPADHTPTTLMKDGEWVVPEARRMLRAHAAAPPHRRLQEATDGSAVFAETACRWVSAALQLRTIRLLLEKGR